MNSSALWPGLTEYSIKLNDIHQYQEVSQTTQLSHLLSLQNRRIFKYAHLQKKKKKTSARTLCHLCSVSTQANVQEITLQVTKGSEAH